MFRVFYAILNLAVEYMKFFKGEFFMTLMRGFKRKAFTLVELLAVVVVIAILAAAIVLVSDEIVSTAHAARILSNLTEFKKAALAWYADNASIVLYNGMIDDEYGKENGNTTGRKSGFREDQGGASSYGVIRAEHLLPYINMSGLKIDTNPPKKDLGGNYDYRGVVDGYGGRYLTDYQTLNESFHSEEIRKKLYGEHGMQWNEKNDDEYIWMIDYYLPKMSEKVKEKLDRKYVHIDEPLLYWKQPGKTLIFDEAVSKKNNCIGIKVLSFSLKNENEKVIEREETTE